METNEIASVWQIDVFESAERLATFKILEDKIDRAEVRALLQRLCSRHLDYQEIIACALGKLPLLVVQDDAKHRTLTCDVGVTSVYARLQPFGQRQVE